MKKKSITLGVVFCIFILCSLTYQPIVANESIDTSLSKKSVNYNNQSKQIDIKPDYKLLLSGIKKDNDCGCYEQDELYPEFSRICGFLAILFFIGLFASIVLGIDFIVTIADNIGRAFNCW
jgi:hypothetical protein